MNKQIESKLKKKIQDHAQKIITKSLIKIRQTITKSCFLNNLKRKAGHPEKEKRSDELKS